MDIMQCNDFTVISDSEHSIKVYRDGVIESDDIAAWAIYATVNGEVVNGLDADMTGFEAHEAVNQHMPGCSYRIRAGCIKTPIKKFLRTEYKYTPALIAEFRAW